MPFSRLYRPCIAVALCAAAASAATVQAAGSERPATEAWYGLFLNGQRAGYLGTTRAPGTFAGRTAEHVVTHLRIAVQKEGALTIRTTDTDQWIGADGVPLREITRTSADGQTVTVRADYDARSVRYRTSGSGAGAGGTTAAGTLSLASGERFWVGGGIEFPLQSAPVTAKGTHLRSFDADRLTLTETEAPNTPVSTVRDSVTLSDGRTVPTALKVSVQRAGQSGAAWLDAQERRLLRMDVGPMRIERMDRASALADATNAPASVDGLTSVAPDRVIDDARALRVGVYRIVGLAARPGVAADGPQSLEATRAADGTWTATVAVRASSLDEAEPALTVAAIDRERFAPYLAASPFAPADDPQMRTLARQIVGPEANAAETARRLTDWVHENIAFDASQGGLRPVAETLRTRRGVCQNYAATLVTLLRAAGIPARQCVGLAYDDGRFWGHAWVECWAGRWVALEPTWGRRVADAARIKLADGEPSTDAESWGLFSPLTIQVLETRADSNPVESSGAATVRHAAR